MAKQATKRTKPTKSKMKNWLKAKGHRAADVDREVDGKDVAAALLALHGVTTDELRRGKA